MLQALGVINRSDMYCLYMRQIGGKCAGVCNHMHQSGVIDYTSSASRPSIDIPLSLF